MLEVTRKPKSKTIFIIFKILQNTFEIRYLIDQNHDAICKTLIQSQYTFHTNTISNRELSDPFCDSINRDLILLRLEVNVNLTKLLIICVLGLKFRLLKMTIYLPIELTGASRISILHVTFKYSTECLSHTVNQINQ